MGISPLEKLMSSRALYAAIARATGDDVREIRRRGFSIVNPGARFDPEPDRRPHQILDWDRVDLGRNLPLVDQPFRR